MSFLRTLTRLSLTAVLALVIAVLPFVPQEASALSGSSFKAGRIIDNSKFFTTGSMSSGQIQSFLNAKVPDCDQNGDETIYDSTHNDTVTRRTYAQRRGVSTPFRCLKSYTQTTTDKSAESGLCSSYNGVSNESSADIIYKVASSCGVSAKVLLVLLQKEQSLVTDDWPWPVQYRSATGYGCPDTAPCDSQYYGFFNQVYRAARQFKRYSKDSHLFNYRAGRNNRIPYHPDAGRCGYSTVYIENQATAGLYNYTPYRPNQAALDNLYGTGNSCSSYGNRNFWRLYNDWFGNTQGNTTLIQETGQPTIYLVDRTDKLSIASGAVLKAWDFHNNSVSVLSPSSIDIYDDGGSLGRTANSRESGYIYFVDRSQAYRANTDTRQAWGIGSGATVASGTISTLQVRTTLPYIAKNSSTLTMYLAEGGNKYPISSIGSLRLIMGSDTRKSATFSDGALDTLTTGSSLNYGFRVGEEWYVFDYDKVRKIHADYTDHWQVSGPTLSSNVLDLFDELTTLRIGFRYNGRYYRLNSDGSHNWTTSKSVAKTWGVYDVPPLSKDLFNKIKDN